MASMELRDHPLGCRFTEKDQHRRILPGPLLSAAKHAAHHRLVASYLQKSSTSDLSKGRAGSISVFIALPYAL